MLNVKQTGAFTNALKRVAKLDMAKATDDQKMKASLDIVKIFQLIQMAWPLIVEILKDLKLPIPPEPTPK